jgi:hypothetical protein
MLKIYFLSVCIACRAFVFILNKWGVISEVVVTLCLGHGIRGTIGFLCTWCTPFIPHKEQVRTTEALGDGV